MKIEGKVALVTGGSQGIGAAFCKALLEKGANVIIADIAKETGEQLSKKLNEQYGSNRTIFVRCDVTSEEDFDNTISIAKGTFGGIDIVCNNAGVGEMADWKKVIDINLNAVIYGTVAAANAMAIKNGGRGGVIVNTASMGGIYPMPESPVYSASKWGVIGFSRSMILYYKSDGVRVNAICPSYTQTDMFEDAAQLTEQKLGKERVKYARRIVISTNQVARGLIQLVEDDTKNGAVMRITAAKGVDYENYRSAKL